MGKVGQLQTPVLVIHAEDDNLVPFELGQTLFEACPEPRSFLKTDGGHNGGRYRGRHDDDHGRDRDGDRDHVRAGVRCALDLERARLRRALDDRFPDDRLPGDDGTRTGLRRADDDRSAAGIRRARHEQRVTRCKRAVSTVRARAP